MSKQSWKGSTLLNPEPPVLVSCGGLDKPNLITIGWTGTICTQPSMVSISVRPERFSHHLIKESGQFAINLPTEALVRSVDWCGVKSGRDVDKFAACGLHAAPGSVLTDCPVLEESPVNMECRITQRIPLGSHDLFLAEVVACDVDESLLDESGKLCLDKAKLIVYSHGEYLALGKKLGTFGYKAQKIIHHAKRNPLQSFCFERVPFLRDQVRAGRGFINAASAWQSHIFDTSCQSISVFFRLPLLLSFEYSFRKAG